MILVSRNIRLVRIFAGFPPHLEVGGQRQGRTVPTQLFTDSCHLGLRTSWAKTKLQNLGSGPSPTSLQIDGNGVESVDSFVYLAVYKNLKTTVIQT